MNLSQKIVELRKSRNWSQEELAFRLGVTRQSVGKWESEAALPELDKVVQMAELFGVSTDYLLKGEGAAENTEKAVATDAEKSAEDGKANEDKTADEKVDDVAVSDKDKRTKTVFAGVSSLFWLVVLSVYLLWSIVGGAWNVSWVVWIAGAVLQGIIIATFGVFGVDVKNGNSDKLKGKSLFARVSSLFWTVVLAVYLVWSFVWGAWGISWVVWIAAAVLQAVIVAIFNICGVDVKEEQKDKSDK